MGSIRPAEAKQYFRNIEKHRIKFHYTGHKDDFFFELALGEKMVEHRKEWIKKSLEERKQRKEKGLPAIFLYENNTRFITFKELINKDLILYPIRKNKRSIPSSVDGFKPGQRKVIYTCFKRNDKHEIKVTQLAGSVGEMSAYHHSEMYLNSSIIKLAQNYVGSNNINLLQPLGQFGSRHDGGTDAAAPRYIYTMLNTLARKIFPPLDDALLTYQFDDNQQIEPEYFVPIIPMILVNGTYGIGSSGRSEIFKYNPRDIVENIRNLMHGRKIQPMIPWYKGFSGTIIQIDSKQKFVIFGEAALLNDESFEITELPIGVSTQTYKETVLEPMLNDTEKSSPFILDYNEYHSDGAIKFVITLSKENLQEALKIGLHQKFKILRIMPKLNLTLFDQHDCLRTFETPEQILEEFFPLRLELYAKRIAYYGKKFEAELLKLKNQIRFVSEKISGILIMKNIKEKDLTTTLIKNNYDSDPVKAWMKKYVEKEEETVEGGDGFDYLTDMPTRSDCSDGLEKLTKQFNQKKEEMEKLLNSTPNVIWDNELTEFLNELNRVEQLEREELDLDSANNWNLTGEQESNCKPSPHGKRIQPEIDAELLRRINKIRNRKKYSTLDNNAIDSDSEHEFIPLANNQPIITTTTTSKQTAVKPKCKKRNLDSESDDSDDDDDDDKSKKVCFYFNKFCRLMKTYFLFYLFFYIYKTKKEKLIAIYESQMNRNQVDKETIRLPSFEHKCEICSQCFSRKSNLIRHKITHTDEVNWPYNCPKCNLKFKRKDEQQNHMKRKHQVKLESLTIYDNADS